MPNSDFFKPEFDKLALDGCIGKPTGQVAYAYIRVSGEEQADEGRSGLPRQIAHIHEAANKHGYKIPWDMVFADDHTGFEFEGRPALGRLRSEYKSKERRAAIVVVEHLDRLSRNADWHQGFLLDEMKRIGILPVFWKEFYSRIERVVLGAIAQEGMEAEIRRMTEGNLFKARSGRVTARVPAYGYKFVDANGNEGAAALRDTYYAIRDDEAAIIRLIYSRCRAGDTLRQIAKDLEGAGVPPPKQYKHWEPTQLRVFIKNEVYMRDFYAHRWLHTTEQKPSKDGLSTRTVKVSTQRPREEWIRVPVPAIVSAEEWEAANVIMKKNQKTARRNAKVPYLLTGLVRCAYCGWNYAGTTSRSRKTNNITSRYYTCPNRNIRPKHLVPNDNCRDALIHCKRLDPIVGDIVCQALLEPKVLLEALDMDATSERNRELGHQVNYLEHELASKNDDDDKLLRAYMAGAFDEHEYAARRKMLKDERIRLAEEVARLRFQVVTPEQLEQRKQIVLAMSEQMHSQNIPLDPPFELKQRIIRLMVDEITVNMTEGWLKLNGALRGMYPIVNTSGAGCFLKTGIAVPRRESGGSRLRTRAGR
ncbi:MAG: recombinase family protein [Chloroflexota bacterium]